MAGDKKSRPSRPLGRFDFDEIHWEIKDDKTIEFEVKVASKYEPIIIKGEKAYKDKFTGDVYHLSAIQGLITQLFTKENVPGFNTPAKISDYCLFLRERKHELTEHWNEPYELEAVESQIGQYLEARKGKNARIVILFVDLEGSTKLSLELDPAMYNKIVKVFVLEMSLVIANFNGYVFKTVGDSVIGIFPADENFTSMCDLAVQAAMIMRGVVEDVINPIFAERGVPEIGFHIGIDIGNVTIDTHGARNIAAFDEIIGHSMNLTAKIQSLAKHNEIFLGRRLYEVLYCRLQELCAEVDLSHRDWLLWDPIEDKQYQVYSFSGKWLC